MWFLGPNIFLEKLKQCWSDLVELVKSRRIGNRILTCTTRFWYNGESASAKLKNRRLQKAPMLISYFTRISSDQILRPLFCIGLHWLNEQNGKATTTHGRKVRHLQCRWSSWIESPRGRRTLVWYHFNTSQEFPKTHRDKMNKQRTSSRKLKPPTVVLPVTLTCGPSPSGLTPDGFFRSGAHPIVAVNQS